MLHGFTQSGPLFHAKTRALEKLMIKSLAPFNVQPTLIYPTGPNRLLPSDIPGFDPASAADDDPRTADSWAWYRHDEATGTYRLLREGMLSLAVVVRDAGGIDGVVGFSQGGAMAAMLAAALEEPRRAVGGEVGDGSGGTMAEWVDELREANAGRPLAFAAIYSGFAARDAGLKWMYEPRIRTPTLHIIGSLDTVVDETMTKNLVTKCEGAVVVEHPGGHHVPVSKEWAMPLIGFIKQKCVDDVAVANGKI